MVKKNKKDNRLDFFTKIILQSLGSETQLQIYSALATGRSPHNLKYTQIHSNILKYTQIYSNVLNCTKMYSNILKYTQIYLNTLKYTQIYSNIAKYTQIY